jgi:hypothetical protein
MARGSGALDTCSIEANGGLSPSVPPKSQNFPKPTSSPSASINQVMDDFPKTDHASRIAMLSQVFNGIASSANEPGPRERNIGSPQRPNWNSPGAPGRREGPNGESAKLSGYAMMNSDLPLLRGIEKFS